MVSIHRSNDDVVHLARKNKLIESVEQIDGVLSRLMESVRVSFNKRGRVTQRRVALPNEIRYLGTLVEGTPCICRLRASSKMIQ